MCPPDAGDIDELIAEAGSYRRALVYQTVGKLEDSYDFEGMMEAARVHGELSRRLTELFETQPFSRKLHLGAGGCHVCPAVSYTHLDVYKRQVLWGSNQEHSSGISSSSSSQSSEFSTVKSEYTADRRSGKSKENAAAEYSP